MSTTDEPQRRAGSIFSSSEVVDSILPRVPAGKRIPIKRPVEEELRSLSTIKNRIDERLYYDTRDVENEDLFEAYVVSVTSDPGCQERAIEAYKEQYAADSCVIKPKAVLPKPPSPFILASNPKKVQNEENPPPVRGKIICCLATTAALLLIFLQSLVLNKYEFGVFYASPSLNSMFGPNPLVLYKLGGLNVNAIRNEGAIYRIFWSNWMHAGWIHIIFNLICQAQVFCLLEPDWGFLRTALLFFISCLGGNLLSSVADPCSTTVGSSGGLFGLMGSIVIYALEFWTTVPRPACMLVFSVLVVVVSILMGFTKSTDNWAHMGGLLFGLLFSLSTVTSLRFFSRAGPKATSVPVSLLPKVTNTSTAAKRLPSGGLVRRSTIKVEDTPNNKPICGKFGVVVDNFLGWSWGLKEMTCRIVGFVGLIICLVTLFVVLFTAYHRHPAGHITFKSGTKCECCYLNLNAVESPTIDTVPWYCFYETIRLPDYPMDWTDFCALSLEELKIIGGSLPFVNSAGEKIQKTKILANTLGGGQ